MADITHKVTIDAGNFQEENRSCKLAAQIAPIVKKGLPGTELGFGPFKEPQVASSKGGGHQGP